MLRRATGDVVVRGFRGLRLPAVTETDQQELSGSGATLEAP